MKSPKSPGPGSEPRPRRVGWLVLVVVLLAGGGAALVLLLRPAGQIAPGDPAEGPCHFVDVTDATGITFQHTDGSSGRHYLVETYSAGVCLFDYDADGDEDLYFLNGAPLPGAAPPATPPTNVLYRNDGAWQFTDVTAEAGVGDAGFGLGVCAGDYDNDGDQDLYVSNFGRNVLYRNDGKGRFEDVTEAAGVGHEGCGAGCIFLDVDRDGDLDLYAAVYLVFSYEKSKPDMRGNVAFYEPPELYEPEPDVLYRNNGDGTFTDISRDSGIASRPGWGMGIVAADYDNDGDADIFIANDVSENFLWRNDGTGKFEEVGLSAGVALDLNGDEQGSMGVDCADYDNDGWLDFYQTSYATQLPSTFRNLGDGTFEEVTVKSGTGHNQLAKVTWGCSFGDYDNDGLTDIFVAAGHVQDLVDRTTTSYHYKETNLLYHNEGEGRFREVAKQSGPGLEVVASSRGTAVGDLDNDGDLDVVIVNIRERPTLLRNDTQNGNHWLQILTRGTTSNRSGVGARVRVTADGRSRIAEVHAGRSYQSHYGTRLHFGLGVASSVERVEVRWPSGAVDELRAVAADQLVVITEGEHPVAARGETR